MSVQGWLRGSFAGTVAAAVDLLVAVRNRKGGVVVEASSVAEVGDGQMIWPLPEDRAEIAGTGGSNTRGKALAVVWGRAVSRGD